MSVGDFTDLSDAPVTKRQPQGAASAYSAALNDESRPVEIPMIPRIVSPTSLVERRSRLREPVPG